MGTGVKDLNRVLKNQSRLTQNKIKPIKADKKFNLDLIQSRTDLTHMTRRLRTAKSLGFSLCISGSPGTGKSVYGRYLAGQLKLPVLQKRASDLFGMYVGQTEKQIASAFEEANDTKSFLIFDEADSFLSRREQAHKSWEISQVNEMLTHMESHPLPFMATTNFAARLDAASLRRFTFKLEFSELGPERVKLAFKYFFKSDAPTALLRVSNLTSGDFHTVMKKCKILGIKSHDEICAELIAESDSKKPIHYPIGFKTDKFISSSQIGE